MSTTLGSQLNYSMKVVKQFQDEFYQSPNSFSLDKIKYSIKAMLENWPQYSDQNTNSSSQIDRWIIIRNVRSLWQNWQAFHYLRLNDFTKNISSVSTDFRGNLVVNSIQDLSGLPLEPKNLDYGISNRLNLDYLNQQILQQTNLIVSAYKAKGVNLASNSLYLSLYRKDQEYWLDLLGSEDLASAQELLRQEFRARKQNQNGLLGFENADADYAFFKAVDEIGVAVLFVYIGGAVISSFGSSGGAAASTGVTGSATESGTLAGSQGLLGSSTTVTGFEGAAGASIGEGAAAGSGAGGLLSGLGDYAGVVVSTAEGIAATAAEKSITDQINNAINPTKQQPVSNPDSQVITKDESLTKYLPFGLLLLLLL